MSKTTDGIQNTEFRGEKSTNKFLTFYTEDEMKKFMFTKQFYRLLDDQNFGAQTAVLECIIVFQDEFHLDKFLKTRN